MTDHPLRQLKRTSWPELINRIAEVVGDEAALNLFIRFPGRHLVVPKTKIANHIISQTIGEEKFDLLRKAFAGEHLKIPNGRLLIINDRNNQIVEDFLNGKKICDLAADYNLCDRQISKIVNTHKDKNKAPKPSTPLSSS